MKFSTYLAAGVLSAALAFGQRPDRGGPGGGEPRDPQQMVEMRVNAMANRLGLTEDQKAKATSIFTDAQTAAQSVRTNSRTTRESLAEAVKNNNAAAIDQLSATLGTLSGQSIAIDSKAEAAFYSILTADQKAKYDSGMRGRPGGPMMGPGGYGRSRN